MKNGKMKPIKFSLCFRQSQPLSEDLRKKIFRFINKQHIGKEFFEISESATKEHQEAHHKVVANKETTIDFFVDEYGNFHPTSLRFNGSVYKLEKQ